MASYTNNRTNSDSSPDVLVKLLEIPWKSNDIINMLYEERERIINRGKECKQLLADVTSIRDKIDDLKKFHSFVSSKTNQLHSECANIIEEKNDLRRSYDRISDMLSKQTEIKNVSKQMPEIKKQILNVFNTVIQKYQQEVPFDDYYNRFFVECRRVKDSISKLENCLTNTNNDELSLHMEEIYTVYFDVREQLMNPIFAKNISGLVTKSNRNYCDLLRQSSLLLIRILRKEIQLFHQLFPNTLLEHSDNKNDAQKETNEIDNSTKGSFKKQSLERFLSVLCKIFYENLRPVVIHVNHLETLTELHKLITETIICEVNEDCYKLTMEQLSQDVQERMIFRTEVFIQESLLDYKPSVGDLAYPEKLEVIIKSGELKDFQSMWYPTVQRTVLALFYLNRVFDLLTFKELAQDIVLACYKSLGTAQKLIDDRHGGTKIEADLFLNKHLAIIKDQLESYGIEPIEFQTTLEASDMQSKVSK